MSWYSKYYESIWSENPAKASLSDINTGQQCYSKMTYFSGFTSHQLRYANFKRINCGFEETKSSRVENNTKTENSGFLSQGRMALILAVTQLF